MTDIAIRVQNLSKCYQIYGTPRDRLKQFIFSPIQRVTRKKPKQYFTEFWALQDISFQVENGEAVAIMGRNGSGKSTLLQIITGMLSASTGIVQTHGCIAALLELGAGFNPDFSGRENVYLNAAVLGLSKDEVDARFDDIAAFADIGEFINRPTKTYSSGMLVRLAFAVNTCIEPEILIVDEALSVGDAPFQSKCFKRLRQLTENGTSLLLVSHDVATVRSICQRALWLKEGQAEMWGDAKEVVKEYEKFCWEEQGIITKEDAGNSDCLVLSEASKSNYGSVQSSWKETVDALSKKNFLLPLRESSTHLGNKSITIDALSITNSLGQITAEFNHGESVTVHYKLLAQKTINSEFMIGIRIRNVTGDFICSVNDVQSIQKLQLSAGNIAYARMSFCLPLAAGDYIIRTGIFGFKDGVAIPCEGYDFSRAILWDIREDAMFIKIFPNKIMPLAGPVNLKGNLEFLHSSIES